MVQFNLYNQEGSISFQTRSIKEISLFFNDPNIIGLTSSDLLMLCIAIYSMHQTNGESYKFKSVDIDNNTGLTTINYIET